MRKITVLLFLLISLASFGQGWEMFYKIKTRNEPFRVAIARDKVVYCVADSALYSLDTTAKATDSLKTVIRWGKYTVIGGGGSSYWSVGSGALTKTDTTTAFQTYSSSATWRSYVTMSSGASGYWAIGSNKWADGKYSYINGYNGSLYLRANFFGAEDALVLNGAGYLDGFSGSGKLALGASNDYWGKLYADSVQTAGVVRAGGTVYGNGRPYQQGVYGQSEYGHGVYGWSDKTSAVYGESNTSIGVSGRSISSSGGEFFSTTGKAIYADAASGYGIIVQRGEVGIGTTAPQANLDVKDTAQVTGDHPVINLKSSIDDGFGSLNFYDNASTIRSTFAYNDNATEVRSHGEQSMKLFTNDTSRVIIDKVGLVGIGKTPSYKLDVNGVVSATGGTSTNWNTAYGWGNHSGLYYAKADTATSLLSQTRAASTYATKSSVATKQDSVKNPWYYSSGNTIQRSTGNVGVGSTNPMHKLVVVTSNATNTNGLNIVNSDANKNRSTLVQAVDTSSFNFNYTPLGKPQLTINGATGQNYMKIDSAGRVGIGTSAPTAKLHVSGRVLSDTTQSAFVLGGSAVGSTITYQNTTGNGGTTGIAHIFKSGNNGSVTGICQLNDGKVGIGKTNPAYVLDINGMINIKTGNYLQWEGGNAKISESSFNLIFSTWTGSSLTEKMRILPLGNVGINTTAPAYKLEVQGKKTAPFAVSADNDGTFGDSTAIVTTAAGKVGIGTTAITHQMNVKNSLKVDSTGAGVLINGTEGIKLSGAATVWKDLEGPFNTGLSGGSAYPAFTVDSAYATFTVDTTAPTICKQYYSIQVNHDGKLGATVYPHIHYKHTTAQGTPTFLVKYRWLNIGVIPGRFSWVKLDQTTGTTNNSVQLMYSTNGIPATNNNISATLQAEVYLLSTTGATKSAYGYSFDIHYEVEKLGSRGETTD